MYNNQELIRASRVTIEVVKEILEDNPGLLPDGTILRYRNIVYKIINGDIIRLFE